MALADWQIRRDVKIDPFVWYDQKTDQKGKLSWGVSSYGYDLRLGYKFQVFKPYPCTVIDPKKFDTRMLEAVDLTPKGHDWGTDGVCRICHGTQFPGPDEVKRQDWCARNYVETPDYILIPPHSFVLAESFEYMEIPRDVIVVVVGKSTLARCSLIVNVTPLEPCVSEDTEVLTRQGWRKVKNVLIGQEVLTRREDGIAEYQPVERKQERRHKGELLNFLGRSVDQLVTEDHSMFCRKMTGSPKYRKWEPKLIPAKEMFGKWNYALDRQVDWRGEKDPETITVGDKTYNAANFMFFLGCYLGDGSAYKGTDGGYHIKLAVVTKEKKRKVFQDIIERLGIQNAKSRERGFEWFDKNLCQWLHQLGTAKKKFIPRKFLNYSPRLLNQLLRGLMESDGTKSTNTYTTASKQLANDVQEVAYKCGFGAIVRKVSSLFDGKGKVLTAYKIRMTSKTPAPKLNPKNQKRVPYDGFVYDITVPNHVFLSRRRGRASWTGNCWKGKVTIEISNTSPLPAKLYPGEGICQCLFFRSDGVAEHVRSAVHYHMATGMTPQTLTQYLDQADDEGTCEVSYADRKGKYDNQTGLTPPKVTKEDDK